MTPNFCPNCGIRVQQEHNFCPDCGLPLTTPASTSKAQEKAVNLSLPHLGNTVFALAAVGGIVGVLSGGYLLIMCLILLLVPISAGPGQYSFQVYAQELYSYVFAVVCFLACSFIGILSSNPKASNSSLKMFLAGAGALLSSLWVGGRIATTSLLWLSSPLTSLAGYFILAGLVICGLFCASGYLIHKNTPV